MSTEENERLTNGTVLHTKAKGVPPIDKMVNTIPPRECHLTLKCVDGTTSKTSPSYNSKFNTTANQTRRWKENKTSLNHENVATTPGRIKSDDETADQTYYDPHLTCNITPPPQQHNDTTMSCHVPWKPRGFLQGLLTQLRSTDNIVNHQIPTRLIMVFPGTGAVIQRLPQVTTIRRSPAHPECVRKLIFLVN